MAVVVSEGSLVALHRTARPSIRGSALRLFGYGSPIDYAKLYREQPNLRLVIRFLSRNIGQLGLKAYRRKSATERVELEDGHALKAFLKNATPSLPRPTSRPVWIRGLVEDLALYDAVFALKLRPAGGKLNAIRVPPTMIDPIGDAYFWPEGFKVRGNLGEKEYAADQVFYMHGHNPEDPTIGLSSVEALRRVLAEDIAAGEYREQFWNNAARVSGYISRPETAKKWGDPARERFVAGWRAAYTGRGPDAGGTPILEDGMTFTEAGHSFKDSEYLGGRRLTREECAAAYFIPPAFVGILEHSNFANIKEQHLGLYSDTLGPWLDWMTEELELQLLPEFDDVDDVYLEFNLEEKLRGRFEEQAAAIQSATGAPWMMRSEARSKFNLPPVEGLDEPVVPLNVLVGGQASPRDSAPDPAAPPRLEVAGRRPELERGGKARNGTLPRYLIGWEAKHREVLGRFFTRQSESVLSKLGAGQNLDEAFDADRWNTELSTDLLALSLGMSEELGGETATQHGAEYDLARTEAYLTVGATETAAAINSSTYEALHVAWSGVPRSGSSARKDLAQELRRLGLPDADDELEDPLAGGSFLDPARNVFAAILETRLASIAISRVTNVGQWSRMEGARQAGVRSKVWISSGSDNSRHDELDGETVPIGDVFSNGGRWPGDPGLGVDETAGCLCSLEFTTETA